MKQRCFEEVTGLHRFFEDWFSGRLRTETDLLRLSTVLDERFTMRLPSAAVLERGELIQNVRSRCGACQPSQASLLIEIKHLRARLVRPPLCRVTYEEWQTLGGKRNGRISDALFAQREGTPHGVVWVEIHEQALSNG